MERVEQAIERIQSAYLDNNWPDGVAGDDEAERYWEVELMLKALGWRSQRVRRHSEVWYFGDKEREVDYAGFVESTCEEIVNREQDPAFLIAVTMSGETWQQRMEVARGRAEARMAGNNTLVVIVDRGTWRFDPTQNKAIVDDEVGVEVDLLAGDVTTNAKLLVELIHPGFVP